MEKHFIRLATILVLLGNSLSASAWGTQGHRIIGEMSENLLTEKAKERINAVLGNASIAMVANWGDEIRSDERYNYTADWHYTNLDAGLSRNAFDVSALQQDNGKNIYSVLSITNSLRQFPSDTMMLKMLIHLVGDMHCPLHLGHAGDRGGNTIQITWFRNETNLHSLWDSGLIDSEKLSYTEYATHLMRIYPMEAPEFDGYVNTVLDWAWDVYNDAQAVYLSANQTTQPYVYLYHYKYLWEKELVKAAEHLAILLNYIYNDD
ncbi:endonuclease [Bacteroidia bacterium]|nr:endonuclease [Bacteroidia bacterium]